jgi:hypothetical protein
VIIISLLFPPFLQIKTIFWWVLIPFLQEFPSNPQPLKWEQKHGEKELGHLTEGPWQRVWFYHQAEEGWFCGTAKQLEHRSVELGWFWASRNSR